jgi:Mor family transcriptional regulator
MIKQLKDMQGLVDALDKVSYEELKAGLPMLVKKVMEIQTDVGLLVEDLKEFQAILAEIVDEDKVFDMGE